MSPRKLTGIFAGVTEFHCRAILGACWDNKAAQYSATYNIPQCYEEQKIELSDVHLQLYDPKLFKPVVPVQFQAAEGECDTNYFHISTLYYKRRACTYSIDMLKYGNDFGPLEEPSRSDCLFRLGCCYEENDEVMQQYPFMPRCYHRVKNEVIDSRLHDMRLVYKTANWYQTTGESAYMGDHNDATDSGVRVCGKSTIQSFIESNFIFASGTQTGNAAYLAVLNYFNTAVASGTVLAGEEHLQPKEVHVSAASGSFESVIPGKATTDICLYKRKDWFSSITTVSDFWKAFDVFDKQYIIETQVPQANIPVSLRGLMNDLF